TERTAHRKVERNNHIWPALLLICITLFAYAPVWYCGFVNFDDTQYVTQNVNVSSGLAWNGIVWAFTTGYAANWHPLTWLSHMLDVQLFGLDAGAHHLINLALHILSTLLLFWVLVQMTRSPLASAFVASL